MHGCQGCRRETTLNLAEGALGTENLAYLTTKMHDALQLQGRAALMSALGQGPPQRPWFCFKGTAVYTQPSQCI